MRRQHYLCGAKQTNKQKTEEKFKIIGWEDTTYFSPDSVFPFVLPPEVSVPLASQPRRAGRDKLSLPCPGWLFWKAQPPAEMEGVVVTGRAPCSVRPNSTRWQKGLRLPASGAGTATLHAEGAVQQLPLTAPGVCSRLGRGGHSQTPKPSL